MTRRPVVAEELLQECFLRLARHATRLRPDTRLAVWLFTVARNLWRSWARWSIVDGSRLLELAASLAGRPAGPATPLDAALTSEAIRRLEREIAALPEGLREVVLLVAERELDHAEVAAILGLTPEAVRQRWSRARARLAAAEERDVA
jgi:RNA polymerase sigma-70 factor (ECF subfamily)